MVNLVASESHPRQYFSFSWLMHYSEFSWLITYSWSGSPRGGEYVARCGFRFGIAEGPGAASRRMDGAGRPVVGATWNSR